MHTRAACSLFAICLLSGPALAEGDAVNGIIRAADSVEAPALAGEDAADLDSAEPMAEPPSSEAAPQSAPLPAGAKVARFQFTTAIEAREPIDSLKSLSTDVGGTAQVYFFTELAGLSDRRVLHRWEHAGQVMAEVGFDVGGPRWRVYSSKQMPADWTGRWTVSVVDSGSGEVLAIETLDFSIAPPTPEAPMAESPTVEEAPPAAPME